MLFSLILISLLTIPMIARCSDCQEARVLGYFILLLSVLGTWRGIKQFVEKTN